MARDYFKKLPKTSRSKLIDGKESSIIATDILFRYKIKAAILNDASLFYPYRWQDQDRPDTVAERYYGSVNFFWVVFYSNNFFDLNFDFPMDQQRFDSYLIRKYQTEISTANAMTLAEYRNLPLSEKIVLAYGYTNSTTKNFLVDEYVVDQETYDLSVGSVRRIQTIFDYEIESNEKKRNVQLLDNEYLGQLLREYSRETSILNSERAALNRIYGSNS